MVGALLLTMMAIAATPAAAPRPEELKGFSDWVVGCDNGRACQAVALVPDPEIGGATLVLTRDAARDAQPRISVTSDGGKAIQLGKRRIPLSGTGDVAARDVPAVLDALRRDPKLPVVDAAGKPVSAVSLAGASAAMLYMDDRQKRVGTTSALVRKGAGTAVPPAPPLPIVLRPAVGPAAPRAISKAEAARRLGDISCDYERDALEPEAIRLDAGHSLSLVMQPCGNGAYNYFGIALLVDEKGAAVPASFDSSPGMAPGDMQTLVNPSWNEKTRLLETYAKGRGLGDCGTMSSFAWDGRRFRLVEQAEMSECRGSVDYITTWRADVRDAR